MFKGYGRREEKIQNIFSRIPTFLPHSGPFISSHLNKEIPPTTG
jgi:hypothetical protein